MTLWFRQAKWTEALTKWEASLPSDLGTEMWWGGIPARCRSRVWPVLIGNAMKITPEVFAQCLARAKKLRGYFASGGARGSAHSSNGSTEDETTLTASLGHEHSMTVSGGV